MKGSRIIILLCSALFVAVVSEAAETTPSGKKLLGVRKSIVKVKRRVTPPSKGGSASAKPPRARPSGDADATATDSWSVFDVEPIKDGDDKTSENKKKPALRSIPSQRNIGVRGQSSGSVFNKELGLLGKVLSLLQQGGSHALERWRADDLEGAVIVLARKADGGEESTTEQTTAPSTEEATKIPKLRSLVSNRMAKTDEKSESESSEKSGSMESEDVRWTDEDDV